MDLFATFVDLAGLDMPNDREFDSKSLKGALLNNTEEQRPVYYYRGNLLYAIRSGSYKMHLWTWNTSPEELKHVNF